MQLLRWMILMLMATPLMAQAQKRFVVHYTTHSAGILSEVQSQFASRQAAALYLRKLPAQLVAKGYLSAAVDTVIWHQSEATVQLFLGDKYNWKQLEPDSAAAHWLGKMGFSQWQNANLMATISPDSLQQSMLNFLANQGFPFASVSFTNIQMLGGNISGKIGLSPGPVYKIDSIVQKGKVKFNRSFLYRYLHIKPAMPYNQWLIDNADARLDELQFAQRQMPSELQMLGTGSTLHVFLEPRRANLLNVLVGLMPVSSQTPNNKMMLTGDVNILLRNAFGGGEALGVNWQQLQYKSPRLNLIYQQPYLFSSKAGIDFQFDLFKKDSQFLNLQVRAGIPYEFTTRQSGKIFYQLQQNNVGFTDTAVVKALRQLPDIADYSLSLVGLQWNYNAADYRFNPRRGMQWAVTGIAGLKTIRKSNDIVQLKDVADPAFNFASLYDTVKLKTYQARIQGQWAGYLPLGGNTVLKTAAQAGWLQSQNYFRNELFQIGGSKLLRGFDEESIYAQAFAVATAEMRYLTGKNSFFFAFADGGFAGYKDEALQYSHRYLGAGLGLSLETKNSQITLSWAVGKRNDQPLNLRQSKIHLGFINYF